MNRNVSIEYANAYSEVLEVLNHMSKEDYNKIPKDMIDMFQINCNNEYKPATPLSILELKESKKMCENIEAFYKTRHLGEFKKSKVSKIISENIKYQTDISDEIKSIILSII